MASASGLRERPLHDQVFSGLRKKLDAIVTGRSATDNWVRIFTPPVEGKPVG